MRERVTLMVLGEGDRRHDCRHVSDCLARPAVEGWATAHCPEACESYAPPETWERHAAYFDGRGESPLAEAEEPEEEAERKTRPLETQGNRVLRILSDGNQILGAISAALGIETDITVAPRHRDRQASAILSSLARKGLVRRVSRGVWGLA